MFENNLRTFSSRPSPNFASSGVACADSCSSLEDETNKREHDEESGMPMMADHDSPGSHSNSSAYSTSSCGEESSRSFFKSSLRSVLRCVPNSSMQAMAVMCFLLTLATIVLPRFDRGVGFVVGYVEQQQQQAKNSFQVPRHSQKRNCKPLDPERNPTRVTVHGRGEVYSMTPLDRKGQWRVAARKDGIMSIMTPVYPDNATLSLLSNQLRSANRFVDMDTFKEWLFITPQNKVDALVDYLENQVTLLPCISADKIRVVADDHCVESLQAARITEMSSRHEEYGWITKEVSGWTKQQMVKLGCSRTVSTPFYLITDSDLFFMSKFQALDLVEQRPCKENSTVCDLKGKAEFRARNEMQPPLTEEMQRQWETSSAEALNISMPEGYRKHMGVTPQIMSRAVVDPMLDHLARIGHQNETWDSYLLRLLLDNLYSTDPTQRGIVPWTEFDLYWLFAVDAGLWDRYHVHSELQKYPANLWQWKDYKKWDPCQENDGARGYWAVVQSQLGMTGEEIWEHLEPCMGHSNG